MGTGTFFEWYDGMPCSDGGAESGKDMTPLFEDALRPQVRCVVCSTRCTRCCWLYMLDVRVRVSRFAFRVSRFVFRVSFFAFRVVLFACVSLFKGMLCV